MKQEGKLNPEQFALAMWLIQRKHAGKEPPAALTPDMVPPSMRPKGQQQGSSSSVYNNPELEMIAKEIQSLLSEKISLEKELQVWLGNRVSTMLLLRIHFLSFCRMLNIK